MFALYLQAEISGHKGTVRMPLELKTGRSTFSAEHKGQVTLYSMMMNQSKNGRPNAAANPGGLLLYLRDGAIQQVLSSLFFPIKLSVQLVRH